MEDRAGRQSGDLPAFIPASLPAGLGQGHQAPSAKGTRCPTSCGAPAAEAAAKGATRDLADTPRLHALALSAGLAIDDRRRTRVTRRRTAPAGESGEVGEVCHPNTVRVIRGACGRRDSGASVRTAGAAEIQRRSSGDPVDIQGGVSCREQHRTGCVSLSGVLSSACGRRRGSARSVTLAFDARPEGVLFPQERSHTGSANRPVGSRSTGRLQGECPVGARRSSLRRYRRTSGSPVRLDDPSRGLPGRPRPLRRPAPPLRQSTARTATPFRLAAVLSAAFRVASGTPSRMARSR